MHPRGRGKTGNWGYAPPPNMGTRPPWRPQSQMRTANDQIGFHNDRKIQHAKGGLKRPSSAPWHNQHQNFVNAGDIWAPIFPLAGSTYEESLPKRIASSDKSRPPNFQPRGSFHQGMVYRPHSFPNNSSHFGVVGPQPWVNHPQKDSSANPQTSFPVFRDGPLMTARIEDVLDKVVFEVKETYPINAIQTQNLRSTARKRIKDMIVGMPLLPAEVIHQMYRNQLDIGSEMESINKLQLGTFGESGPDDIFLEDKDSVATEGQDNTKIIDFPQEPEFLFQPVTAVTSIMMARISQTVGQLVKDLKNSYRITNHQGKGIKQIIHTRMVDIMIGKPVHDEQEMYKMYRKQYPDTTDPWLIKSLGVAHVVKKFGPSSQNSQNGISNEKIKKRGDQEINVKKESANLSNTKQENVTAAGDSTEFKAKLLGRINLPQTVNKPISKKAAVMVKSALTKIYQQMERKHKLTSVHFALVRPIVRSRLQILVAQNHPQTARDLCIMYRDQYDLGSDEELFKAVPHENVISTVNTAPEKSDQMEQNSVTMKEVDSNVNADEMYSLQSSEDDNISVLEKAQESFKEDFKEHTKLEGTNFKEQKLKLHAVIESKVNDIFTKLIKLFEADDSNNSNGSININQDIDKSDDSAEHTELSNTARDDNICEISPEIEDEDGNAQSNEDFNWEDYTLERSMAQIIPTMLTRFKPHLIKIITKDRELIKAGMPDTWASRPPFCPKTLRYAKIFGRPKLPIMDSVREFLELYDPSVLLELRFKADAPIEALFVGMETKQSWQALTSKRTYIVGGEIIGVYKAMPDILYKYRNFLKNVDLWNPTTENKDTQTEDSNASLTIQKASENKEYDRNPTCSS